MGSLVLIEVVVLNAIADAVFDFPVILQLIIGTAGFSKARSLSQRNGAHLVSHERALLGYERPVRLLLRSIHFIERELPDGELAFELLRQWRLVRMFVRLQLAPTHSLRLNPMSHDVEKSISLQRSRHRIHEGLTVGIEQREIDGEDVGPFELGVGGLGGRPVGDVGVLEEGVVRE